MISNRLRFFALAALVLAAGCGRDALKSTVNGDSTADSGAGDGGGEGLRGGDSLDGVGDGIGFDGAIDRPPGIDFAQVDRPPDQLAFPDVPPAPRDMTPDMPPPTVVLLNVSLNPPLGTVAVGTMVTITATGVYSDGSRRDLTTMAVWTSSNSNVASVLGGILRGLSAGTATITVTVMGQTRTATFTISAASVTSLAIEPPDSKVPVNGKQPLRVVATLSDNSKQDVTLGVTWSSSDPAVASVAPDGTVTGQRAGTATVSANLMAFAAKANVTVTAATLNSIQVSPINPVLGVPGTQAFTATGLYSDATTSDLTKVVTWSSSDPMVLGISNNAGTQGVAMTLAPGAAVVTANFSGQTAQTAVTVSRATLTSIAVTPAFATVPKGTTQAYTATGTYSDMTTQDVTATVAWSASNNAVAAVSNVVPTLGLATGLSAGTTGIVATLAGVTGMASLTVTDATATTLTIAPRNGTVAKATTLNFTASANFSDGTTKDVTAQVSWATTDTTVATISNTAPTVGQLIGVKAGTSGVTASFQGKNDMVSVTVTDATLNGITVTPATNTMVSGQRQNYTAQGMFSDGTTQNITAQATWTSDNVVVATVANAMFVQGQVTAVGAGTTTLHALFGGKDGISSITVTAPMLSSLSISPINPTRRVGQGVGFGASAINSNGTSQNVTLTTLWTSSAPNVATVGMFGQATCRAVGTTTITGVYTTVMDTSVLTCTMPVLTGIQVTPFLSTVLIGQMQPFDATGLFSDGTTQNVTNLSTWTTSNAAVADVTNAMRRGVAVGVTAGMATITATYMGYSAMATVTVSSATLQSVAVSPVVLNLKVGQMQGLSATGIYSDGSTRNLTGMCTWVSMDPTIADVSNAGGGGPFGGGRGQVTAIKGGATKITATCMGFSDTAMVNVSTATLMSVSVSPVTGNVVVGGNQQFQATAIFSDGTSQNVTGVAGWTSSNSAIADVTNGGGVLGFGGGQATGIVPGTATIKATYMSLSATATLTVSSATLTSISVSPVLASMVVGGTQQLQATAIYSDGTSQNVTGAASWTSSAAGIADVSNGGFGGFGRGLVTGIAQGMATITASYMSKTDASTITVTGAKVASISVTPINATLTIGSNQQYQAVAIYDDGHSANVTGAVAWTTSDMTVADVSNGFGRGTVTALKAGNATISATYMTIKGSASVTVSSATLQSIQVTPGMVMIAKGIVQQLQATGIYSDGTSQPLTGMATWTSSNAAVADVSDGSGSRGQVTAISMGTADITARVGMISGKSTVTVTVANITEIQVSPTNPMVLINGTQQFQAIAVFSDFTTRNVTGDGLTTWSSSNGTAASVSNAFGSKGQARGLASGTSTITANYMGAMGSSTITVSSATVTSIQVTPTNPSSPVGVRVQFAATALLSDMTTQDVTAAAVYTSSDETVATISNAGGTRAQSTALKGGTTTIKATLSGVSGQTTYTVWTEALTGISVVPMTATIARSTTQQFTATGNYQAGKTYDITRFATWISTMSSVGTVSNAPGSQGLATGVAAGNTTVNAYFNSLMGGAALTVN